MTEEQKQWHKEAEENYLVNVKAFQINSTSNLEDFSDKEIEFLKNAPINQTLMICSGQLVPSGFVIVQQVTNFGCPGDLAWIIKRPEQQETVCSNSPIPNGYVIIQQYTGFNCHDNKAWVIKIPGQQETVCSNSPIPDGYVIVHEFTNYGCPGNKSYVIRRL